MWMLEGLSFLGKRRVRLKVLISLGGSKGVIVVEL